MIVSLVVFFAVLAVLVLVHEFGHFSAARRRGVKIEEFGFGFPPRLFGFKYGQTLYSFNLIPLGGFVKIFGEDSSASDDPENFASRSVIERAVIVVAGVIFNIILAYFLFTFVLWFGMPVDADDPLWGREAQNPQITIIDVLPSSPAAAIGIEKGDKIIELKLSNRFIKPAAIGDVQNFINENQGSTINLEISRKGKELNFKVDLPQNRQADEGILGIAMANIGILKKSIFGALWFGMKMTISAILNTLKGLIFIIGLLFSGKNVSGLVSGPIGIFSIVGSSLNFGYAFLLTLTATLSVNLAIINFFPIPGLDGGRLFFLAIEALRGRPISQKASSLAHSLGFAILILLMAVVTYYDLKTRF
jgi:regulator of sigma E protease